MTDASINGGLGFTGLQDIFSAGSDFNAMQFIARMQVAKMATATLVQVQAVTTQDQVGPVGYVDILPLVNQVDGLGNATQHVTVYHCPYLRIQGGANAVIIDPEVGDIGIAVFAHNDISSVSATATQGGQSQGNPGSARKHDHADGMYLGGVINKAPTQYVQFVTTGAGQGINIISPTQITINSPTINLIGNVVQTAGAAGGTITAVGPMTVTNNVTAGGKSMDAHVHTGVATGSSNSGPPA